jgi:hypothetical protein
VYATLWDMLGAVLVLSGLVAAVYGSWRGYAGARAALLPLVRDGDPTRSLIEAARPIHARVRLRLAVRHLLFALVWLVVAMYGMYLATVGLTVRA